MWIQVERVKTVAHGDLALYSAEWACLGMWDERLEFALPQVMSPFLCASEWTFCYAEYI